MVDDTVSVRSLDYVFKYFDLHAKQRMTVFNFFLVVAGILTGGIAASLNRNPPLPVLSGSLSVVLILVSVVFWKLDIRTSFLIKHAEAALKVCEQQLLIDEARLIASEGSSFEIFQKQRKFGTKAWSYSDCFATVFSVMILLGLLGLGLSAFA